MQLLHMGSGVCNGCQERSRAAAPGGCPEYLPGAAVELRYVQRTATVAGTVLRACNMRPTATSGMPKDQALPIRYATARQ